MATNKYFHAIGNMHGGLIENDMLYGPLQEKNALMAYMYMNYTERNFIKRKSINDCNWDNNETQLVDMEVIVLAIAWEHRLVDRI